MGRLIGVYSSRPQQGKSRVAKRLVEKHGFKRVPFAALLKQWLCRLLVDYGYSEKDVWRYLEDDKHVPLNRLPGMPTARHLLITLGTDWGRNLVSPNLWLQYWIEKTTCLLNAGYNVVADDMRLPNEASEILSQGGFIWRIERPPSTAIDLSDESIQFSTEGRLNNLSFSKIIKNDGTLDELHAKIDAAVLTYGQLIV
jgi:hypothetical protein